MARFTAGDKVRCIEDSTYAKVGDVGVVDEKNSSVPIVRWEGGKRNPIAEDRLELVGKPSEFKKGDRIRTTRCMQHSDYKGNEVFTLKSNNSGGSYKISGMAKCGHEFFTATEMVLDQQPSELRVGDRVRITTEVGIFNPLKGATGIVSSVGNGSVVCKPWSISHRSCTDYHIGFGHLEIVERPPTDIFRQIRPPAEPTDGWDKESIKSLKKILNKEKKMNAAKKFIEKNLSPKERVLRKQGLRDSEGWTMGARELVIEMLLEDKRLELVKFAEEQAAEEKKAKKE